eukprot:CAMPEP_0204630780 /NCGR_PEP_ID=MMETSP0717-20131115/21209_1 /ASSEMBLY_ACC=CAM_ASM_000666 /TAXON_ID=230516 /ORGANISM="Chaetoceros curvisetus" /LENGTH=35 /DNA_ID= /DNA_START= /DNA_END= /DNA_ORIENTATION=
MALDALAAFITSPKPSSSLLSSLEDEERDVSLSGE